MIGILLLSTSVWSQNPVEAGGAAPVGCWLTRGGSLARTGAAATDPIRGEIDTAWDVDLPGTIEGEPLVWNDRVFVATNQASGRQLHVLSLRDGKRSLAPKTFKTDVPLDPCVFRDLVVVRSGSSTLEAFLCGQRVLDSRWKWDAKASVSGPLVHEKEIYVRAGDDVVRIELGSREPTWRRTGPFRGEISIRGTMVYAVAYEEGSATLHALSRSDGKSVASAPVGHHEGKVPDRDAEIIVAVFDRQVVVHHALPVPLEGGGSSRAATCKRGQTPGGDDGLSTEGLSSLSLPGAGAGSLWVGFGEDAGKPALVRLSTNPGEATVLADKNHHAAYVEAQMSPSLAGDIVHLGSRQFDPESGSILWEGGFTASSRAIPARETLIVATRSNRLTAFRTGGRPSVSAAVIGPVQTVRKGRAVREDGSIIAGVLEYDPAQGLVQHGRSKVDLREVLMLLDEGNKPVHVRDAPSARRALAHLTRTLMAKNYVDLASEATTAKELALADRFLAQAQELLADAGEITQVSRRLALLRRRTPESDPTRAAALEQKASAIVRSATSFFSDVLSGLPHEAPRELRVEVIRHILERDPAHAIALEAVKGMLPANVAGSLSADPLGCLEFAEATGQTKIQPIEPPRPDQTTLGHGQRELGSALHTWRKDLIGVESDQLLILTPLAEAGRLARCLSMGELICDALEGMFASGKKKRDARYPLKLHLFESQEEYLRESTKGIAGFGALRAGDLEWTSGHYDSRAGMSRIFLPKERDAFRQVMSVYAHELTHHWLAERCPLFSTDENRPGAAGFWVVEGFATFVQEGRVDLTRRVFDPFNPKAASIDTVGNATADQLLPWSTVFSLTKERFGRLDPRPRHKVPLRWTLGRHRVLSPRRMLYEQAAAACHYLYHAEDGRLRPKLLEFVGLHYTGHITQDGSLQELFGMDADTLGKRIVAWCAEIEPR